jgi:ferredoxin
MHTITLKTRSGALTFSADDAKDLLLCAQDAEIYIPSSCRNGTCRTCLSLCTSGSVRYDIGWPGVSREEKEEGWILPCVAIACSDLELENSSAYKI